MSDLINFIEINQCFQKIREKEEELGKQTTEIIERSLFSSYNSMKYARVIVHNVTMNPIKYVFHYNFTGEWLHDDILKPNKKIGKLKTECVVQRKTYFSGYGVNGIIVFSQKNKGQIDQIDKTYYFRMGWYVYYDPIKTPNICVYHITSDRTVVTDLNFDPKQITNDRRSSTDLNDANSGYSIVSTIEHTVCRPLITFQIQKN